MLIAILGLAWKHAQTHTISTVSGEFADIIALWIASLILKPTELALDIAQEVLLPYSEL